MKHLLFSMVGPPMPSYTCCCPWFCSVALKSACFFAPRHDFHVPISLDCMIIGIRTHVAVVYPDESCGDQLHHPLRGHLGIDSILIPIWFIKSPRKAFSSRKSGSCFFSKRFIPHCPQVSWPTSQIFFWSLGMEEGWKHRPPKSVSTWQVVRTEDTTYVPHFSGQPTTSAWAEVCRISGEMSSKFSWILMEPLK